MMNLEKNTGSEIKFTTTMLRSSICENNDAYVLVKETIKIAREGADAIARQLDKRNIQKLHTIHWLHQQSK